MNALPSLLPLAAAAGRPPTMLALLIVLGGIALLMVGIAAFGRFLAAGHPAPAPRAPTAVNPLAVQHAPVPAPVLAAISAAVVSVLGRRAHVTSVHLEPPAPAPSVETLMGQWSLEGRRQIYSSHKLR